MLSKNLQSLSAFLAERVEAGTELTPETVTKLHSIVNVCAEDARQLERHRVERTVKLEPSDFEHSNLTLFPIVRRSRP